MPKRNPRHPSLRGYQVTRWINEGILKASRLGDTPVLVVEEAKRVRLTSRFLTTLSQGIFLVPRWIRAPKRDLKKLCSLSADEQNRAGLIYREGKARLLIFQQVKDVFAAVRQPKHIVFDQEQTEFFRENIAPHLLARRGAAAMLARCRVRDLQGVQRGLAILSEKLVAGGVPSVEAAEMLKYLDTLISVLDQVVERPFVTRRKRAQRSLRAAQHWIGEEKFAVAVKRVRKAREKLNPLAELTSTKVGR